MTQNDQPTPPSPSDQPVPPYPKPPAAGATPPVTTSAPGGPVEYASVASHDDRQMAMLAHLLGIVLGFIGPLIIWLIKKDQSPFVNDQGKEALNFQITVLIAHLVAGLSWMICIGVILTPAVIIASIVFCIIAGMAANRGEPYRYPLNIRLIQ